MDDRERDRLHHRVARRLHHPVNEAVTVEGLEQLREEALRGKHLSDRRKAATTYKALTGVKP